MEGVTDGNVFTQPLLQSNMHSREEELQQRRMTAISQYLGYAVSLPLKMKFHLYFFHAHTKLSIAESQDVKIQQGLTWKLLGIKCKIFVMALQISKVKLPLAA